MVNTTVVDSGLVSDLFTSVPFAAPASAFPAPFVSLDAPGKCWKRLLRVVKQQFRFSADCEIDSLGSLFSAINSLHLPPPLLKKKLSALPVVHYRFFAYNSPENHIAFAPFPLCVNIGFRKLYHESLVWQFRDTFWASSQITAQNPACTVCGAFGHGRNQHSPPHNHTGANCRVCQYRIVNGRLERKAPFQVAQNVSRPAPVRRAAVNTPAMVVSSLVTTDTTQGTFRRVINIPAYTSSGGSPVVHVLDIDEHMGRLAQWVAEYYRVSLGNLTASAVVSGQTVTGRLSFMWSTNRPSVVSYDQLLEEGALVVARSGSGLVSTVEDFMESPMRPSRLVENSTRSPQRPGLRLLYASTVSTDVELEISGSLRAAGRRPFVAAAAPAPAMSALTWSSDALPVAQASLPTGLYRFTIPANSAVSTQTGGYCNYRPSGAPGWTNITLGGAGLQAARIPYWSDVAPNGTIHTIAHDTTFYFA